MTIKSMSSFYISSFKGLSKEVWWLALLTLINRAGTMVIPFLSLYLTEDRGFSLENVAWVMSAFGLGSVGGSWLGGYLNDKIGSYKTMVFSLFASGVLFTIAQYPTNIYAISFMVFIVMLAADIFRPAMFVALRAYSKPENQTRSLSLIRLAINLGFSVGPALGGFLISYGGYGALFWVDGVTCTLAALLLILKLNPKKAINQQEEQDTTKAESAYKDRVYLLFALGVMLFGFIFLQYFSTVPLYYRQSYHLSEEVIGLLMGFNGLLVFVFEMPLIKYLEARKKHPLYFASLGVLMLLISFLVFNLNHWTGWLWIGMFWMSIGEMYAFPFANAFAMERAKRGKLGQYMGLYTLSFSISHILGHNSGMQLIHFYGYPLTWWFFTGLCIVGLLVFLRTMKLDNRTKEIV